MNLRTAIPIAVLLPVVGCTLGWAVGSSVFADSHVAWRTLGAPVSPAASFVHASTQIIVRSQDRLLYSLQPGIVDTWHAITEEEARVVQDDSYSQCPRVSPPRLQGVVAEAEACHGYGDIILTTAYAIDQSGRVWWWRGHSYLKWDYALWGAFASLALAVLLVVGTILIALFRRLRRQTDGTIH